MRDEAKLIATLEEACQRARRRRDPMVCLGVLQVERLIELARTPTRPFLERVVREGAAE